MKFGVGQSVKRSEDLRFITGHGQYTDDIKLPGMAHAYVLRSPYAHAKILSIDSVAAAGVPGVVGVLTGADLAQMGVQPLDHVPALPRLNGETCAVAPVRQPVLATDKVRYAGAPIAFIVADSVAAAREAAELVMVDYEDLPAIGTLDAALAPGAALLWDEAPGNIAFDWQAGDASAADAAFAAAAHIAEVSVVQNRIVCNAMETRAAIGAYDPAAERFTLVTNSQGSHTIRRGAAACLGVAAEVLHVVTPDVGGGFGMKGFLYPEQVLVCAAARAFGRPVKWTGDRAEAHLADAQGRAGRHTVRLALDAEGRIQAMSVDNLSELGGFIHQFAPFVVTLAGGRIWGGPYKVPHVKARVRGVLTNAMGIDAYRGAGRPEGAYFMERVMEEAGRVTGLGPLEIRRRNFLSAAELPAPNWTGLAIDSAEFRELMEAAVKTADWDGFAARKAASAKAGKKRGIGLSSYLEISGAMADQAEIRFTPNGGVQVIVGTQSNGQGHETTFKQVVAEALGVPFESIDFIQGDTDTVAKGGGTGGSKSLHLMSGAIETAAKTLIEKGTAVAAHLLETQIEDIAFDRSGDIGLFRSEGKNLSVSLPEVALAAARPGLPDALTQMLGERGLGALGEYTPAAPTLPNGCHVAEVEVDPETGQVKIVRYTVVDDFGTLVNPMIVEGQVHGGIAQGVGQALIENAVYDPDTAQLITGSFMDYGMPRADDLPPIHFTTRNVRDKHNPLGVKGCGEAGTTGALAAVVNAVIDALRDYGISHVDMPATPESIWRLIEAAKAGKAA